MNLSDEDLEKELASLRPTAPSELLKSNIEEELEEQPETRSNKIVQLWPFLAIAAAACLALVLVLSRSKPETFEPLKLAQNETTHTHPTDPFADYEAVETEQRLFEAIDDGVVMVVNNEPVRRLRYQFIDSVTMVDQTDGSVFTMEVPREETLFVSVTLL
jgi:hypothetical protein